MRLIDADALNSRLSKETDYSDDGDMEINADSVFIAISEAPTIDPVKHGKWEDENPIEPNPMFRAMVCSVCGRTEGSPNDFCPYCGAKMDGEV